ncbi:putative pyruvate formate lyase activating enzyme [Ruminococcaceae bacterium YRB3002]|nr:putative pyruvate formate lyase activating enzyme [Ruminococcaceae bacterium YRB3002]
MDGQPYRHCVLCPRRCGADRTGNARGYCGMGDIPVVNLCRLHLGEEPVISGTKGSGTIFFEGCSLGCAFCQNYRISMRPTGKGIVADGDKLSDMMLKLQEMGAHNINLVTPMHFAPTVREQIIKAKERELNVPVALNISGYENVETVRIFEKVADIFLTDFKFWSDDLAYSVCRVKDYREKAVSALEAMVSITGAPVKDGSGLLRSGVIVRHLMLPKHIYDTKHIIDYLVDTYDKDIIISLMDQYTPTAPAIDACQKGTLPPEFGERVNKNHYETMCDYLAMTGSGEHFMQEGDASGTDWIPDFVF